MLRFLFDHSISRIFFCENGISEKTKKVYVFYFSPDVAQTSVKTGLVDTNSVLCIVLVFHGKKVPKTNILNNLLSYVFILKDLGNTVLANLEGSKSKILPLRLNNSITTKHN